MSSLSLFYLVSFCNIILASSWILTPMKTDGNLRIFKESPNDFENIIKRQNMDSRPDDSDSKERRSSMGSSFIRYGRSEGSGNMENVAVGADMDGGSTVNRYPRWKSPDIVIRFGRSGLKAVERGYKRGRNDLNFIRYGRNAEIYPMEVDLTSICPELLTNNRNEELRPYVVRLLRLCKALNNVDSEHRNPLDFLEEQADSKHE